LVDLFPVRFTGFLPLLIVQTLAFSISFGWAKRLSKSLRQKVKSPTVL